MIYYTIYLPDSSTAMNHTLANIIYIFYIKFIHVFFSVNFVIKKKTNRKVWLIFFLPDSKKVNRSIPGGLTMVDQEYGI